MKTPALLLLSLALGPFAACKTAPSPDAYYQSVHNAKPKSADEDPCPATATDCHPHRFLVADDGLSKLSYVNLDDPSKDWDLAVESSVWDMQLAGGGKVLVTTTQDIGGYLEVDINTGKVTQSFTDIGFTRTVQRLKNGHTLIAGENLAGEEGTVVIEMDENRKVLSDKTIRFPKIKNSRVVRRTRANTYLLGSTVDNQDDQVLMEMDDKGEEVRRFEIGSGPGHMGLRLPSGDTAVTSGRDLSLLIFDDAGKVKQKIVMANQKDKDAIDPYQAGYFQILANHHYVLTNWQGKNANSGRKGRQLVEYNAKGEQVWSWKQDPKRFSSISAVIVLDGLNTDTAYDDTNGALEPVR